MKDKSNILSYVAIVISAAALAVSIYSARGHRRPRMNEFFGRDGHEQADFRRQRQNGERPNRPGDRQRPEPPKQEPAKK